GDFRCKLWGERLALVEHKAVARVVGPAYLLEVSEYSAVELERVDALVAHVDRGLLTADPAGAEAHHRLALKRVTMGRYRVGKLGEALDAPIDGARERPVVDFKGVARIEHDDIAALVIMPLVEPTLERARRHRRCAPLDGTNRWM